MDCSNRELESFRELLQKGLNVIAKFRIELKVGRLSYTSLSGEIGDEVSKTFSDIGRFYNNSDRQSKTVLADYIATAPTILKSLYDFLRELFKAVSSLGLEEEGTLWITFFLSSFVEWSDVSQKFRCKVLDAGLLFDHIKEVTTLKSDSDSKFVKDTVTFNLSVIFNCSQEANFSLYYERESWTNFFLPWLSCKHLNIKWNCKFILGNLIPILEDEELSLLDLEDEEMSLLVAGLEAATKSKVFKVQILSMVFTILELLRILSNLIASPRNYYAIATPSLIQPLVKVVTWDRLPEQVAACTLIWKLLERLPLQRPLGAELQAVITALQPLRNCGQPRLQILSKCIIMEMEGISTNSDDFIGFIEGCYASQKYEECIYFCKSSTHIQNFKDRNLVTLLEAKAMYMLYHKEVLRLRKSKALMLPKVYHNSHVKCYDKAKEIIAKLSRNELVQADKEASKMLDMAIRDVIEQTNELFDVHVCYLCRRNLLDISNYDELHSIAQPKQECMKPDHGVTPNNTRSLEGMHPQQRKTKMKLARSHYFPNSILKKFSHAHPLPSDQQTYVFLYDNEARKSDRLYSARQITLYMLCLACEGIISRNGEEQFPSLFFNKIYDQSDPLKSKSMLKIEYGKWLYTFCLGMIFRNLHWHKGYYINENELYQLLVQCRTCLLNIDSIQSIDDKPEIFLLVNPLFSTDEDAGYGYMNVVLNNACASCLRDISLDSGAPQQMCAHFFIVHMGVINILVKFSPAESVQISSEYLVHPDGGVYTVPPNEARKALIPAGVWKLFQSIAQDIEIRTREYPVRLDEKLEKKPSRQPTENVKDVFGIVQGLEIDKQLIHAHEGVTPSPSKSESKKLNLLPSTFQVRPGFHPSAVLLPKGHSILLHYTEYLPDHRQSVLFLCIGDDGIYSCDKPYLIWHYEGPGLISTAGFFVSTVDSTATEFLPDDNPKAMLKGKQPSSLAPFVKRIPELLPQMLKLKGFYSLHSLLFRVKALRKIPNMDRKCSKKKHCWYCSHLCNTCLTNPSVFGMTKSGPNEQQFNFCSSKCQEFHPEAAIADKSMLVIDSKGKQHQLVGYQAPAIPSRCTPISLLHEEILHIFVLDKDDKGYPQNTEISLCKEDGTDLLVKGRQYVVLYQQTLNHQRFLEFFVISFFPEAPLPYLKSVSEDIMIELNKLSVQSYIQEAMNGLYNVKDD